VRWLEEGRVYRFPKPDDALIATAAMAVTLLRANARTRRPLACECVGFGERGGARLGLKRAAFEDVLGGALCIGDELAVLIVDDRHQLARRIECEQRTPPALALTTQPTDHQGIDGKGLRVVDHPVEFVIVVPRPNM